MADEFQYDVFLSHSSKDKAVVRELAERLKKDGVRLWLDEEQIKPGDNIPAKIEEGLELSRVLVLCMSANAFGSDWAQLEAGTFRFRDPLNKERRFIPLRLDDAPIKGSLAQFLYIDWHTANREKEYVKLLEASRRPASWPAIDDNKSKEPSSLPFDTFQKSSSNIVPAELEILEAVPDHGWIYVMRTDAYGQFLNAGDGKFFEPEDASVQAKYLDAFDSLCAKGMVRPEGMGAYKLTGRGFELRKQAKSTAQRAALWSVDTGAPPPMVSTAGSQSAKLEVTACLALENTDTRHGLLTIKALNWGSKVARIRRVVVALKPEPLNGSALVPVSSELNIGQKQNVVTIEGDEDMHEWQQVLRFKPNFEVHEKEGERYGKGYVELTTGKRVDFEFLLLPDSVWELLTAPISPQFDGKMGYKCSHCGFAFLTQANALTVTCPKCKNVYPRSSTHA